MDKLAPVLKQKFWILLGIGVIMTITGWWMATGTLAATTKIRREKVEAAFKRIPGGEIPNNDWSSKLATRNTEQDRAVKATAAMLWERQKSRMTWPESVVNFAWTKGYRGEILLPGRENYRLSYGYDVRRVWESVRPFKMIDGSGVVLYGADEKVLPQVKWGQLAPSSNDMWDAQEDLWLLESLLQAIVAVNGREGGRADASIHVIEKLQLCGGQPPAQRKAGGGTTGNTMGGGSMPGAGHGMAGPPNSGFGATGGDLGGGMGARAGGAALGDANFDPKDELGDDGSAKAGGMGGGATGGMMSAGPASSHGAAGPPGGMGAGGPGAAANVRRYVEDDAALPFKSRGFYMTVIMDHRKIPSLIAELTANEYSAWPVEILRVQMVRLHDDDVGSGTGAAGSMAGGMGAGGAGGGLDIRALLSAGGPAGNMASGFPGAPGATSEGFTPPNTTTSGAPGAPGQAATNNPAAGGIAALQSALQDPYMARVAICGVITLYKEVKPEPVVATPATPTPPAAVAPVTSTTPDPAATQPGTQPSAEGTPEAKPADAPETPDAPANPTPAPAAPPANPPADPAAPPDPAKTPEKT